MILFSGILGIIIDILMAPIRVFMRDIIGIREFGIFYGCVIMQGLSLGVAVLPALEVASFGTIVMTAIIFNLIANNVWIVVFHGRKAFPSFSVRRRLIDRIIYQSMSAYVFVRSI